MKLTGRTLDNFVNKTVNFTVRARKICLDILDMTVNAKFDFLANLVSMDLTNEEKATIHLFCYDDFNKLYK
jgi:hypothetical protein